MKGADLNYPPNLNSLSYYYYYYSPPPLMVYLMYHRPSPVHFLPNYPPLSTQKNQIAPSSIVTLSMPSFRPKSCARAPLILFWAANGEFKFNVGYILCSNCKSQTSISRSREGSFSGLGEEGGGKHPRLNHLFVPLLPHRLTHFQQQSFMGTDCYYCYGFARKAPCVYYDDNDSDPDVFGRFCDGESIPTALKGISSVSCCGTDLPKSLSLTGGRRHRMAVEVTGTIQRTRSSTFRSGDFDPARTGNRAGR